MSCANQKQKIEMLENCKRMVNENDPLPSKYNESECKYCTHKYCYLLPIDKLEEIDTFEDMVIHCQRMDEEDVIFKNPLPEKYNKAECDGCEYICCELMPKHIYDKFMQGERKAMFPNGEDDEYDDY